MSARTTARAAPTVEAWRVFVVEVRAVRRLSPSFVRITFTGADLHRFADPGFDQRIKLVLPAPGRRGLEGVPLDRGWTAIRELPDQARPRLRTYTTRAVRPHVREVDVDLVLHGDVGPASRFAGAATVGDVVALLGPDVGYDGDHGGLEFRPPAGTPVLLVADETAVPAAARILEQLPVEAAGEAVLEVPHAEDRLDLVRPAGVRVTWLPREGAAPGSLLQGAVVDALSRSWPQVIGSRVEPDAGPDTPPDDLLWDVPEAVGGADLYAWMAGEAGAITRLRRYLVRDLGVPRAVVAFMGYWRKGRAAAG